VADIVTCLSTALSSCITLYIAETKQPTNCTALSIKFEQTLLLPIQWPRPFKKISYSLVVRKFPMKLLINNQFLVSVCCVYREKKRLYLGRVGESNIIDRLVVFNGRKKDLRVWCRPTHKNETVLFILLTHPTSTLVPSQLLH